MTWTSYRRLGIWRVRQSSWIHLDCLVPPSDESDCDFRGLSSVSTLLLLLRGTRFLVKGLSLFLRSTLSDDWLSECFLFIESKIKKDKLFFLLSYWLYPLLSKTLSIVIYWLFLVIDTFIYVLTYSPLVWFFKFIRGWYPCLIYSLLSFLPPLLLLLKWSFLRILLFWALKS